MIIANEPVWLQWGSHKRSSSFAMKLANKLFDCNDNRKCDCKNARSWWSRMRKSGCYEGRTTSQVLSRRWSLERSSLFALMILNDFTDHEDALKRVFWSRRWSRTSKFDCNNGCDEPLQVRTQRELHWTSACSTAMKIAMNSSIFVRESEWSATIKARRLAWLRQLIDEIDQYDGRESELIYGKEVCQRSYRKRNNNQLDCDCCCTFFSLVV